jgi:hypothetical protein
MSETHYRTATSPFSDDEIWQMARILGITKRWQIRYLAEMMRE